METTNELWVAAERQARRFLDRFRDAETRRERDDLVQESALAAWQWFAAAREPGRLGAAVRTIARRKRCRLLAARRRESIAEESAPARVVDDENDYVIGGRQVSRSVAVARLRAAMERLPTIDRGLLSARQEGFCHAEIADRSGMTETAVRVRLHRARHRLRQLIERAVAVAAGREGGITQEKA